MAWCQPPGWAEKHRLAERRVRAERDQIARSLAHERGRVSDDRKRWSFQYEGLNLSFTDEPFE